MIFQPIRYIQSRIQRRRRLARHKEIFIYILGVVDEMVEEYGIRRCDKWNELLDIRWMIRYSMNDEWNTDTFCFHDNLCNFITHSIVLPFRDVELDYEVFIDVVINLLSRKEFYDFFGIIGDITITRSIQYLTMIEQDLSTDDEIFMNRNKKTSFRGSICAE